MPPALAASPVATPATPPNETVLDGPRATEPETAAVGVEADPELRDAVDGTADCAPARLVPGTVVGTDGTFTPGVGTGGVLTVGTRTGAVVTVGTVTDGTVTVGTGIDGVV